MSKFEILTIEEYSKFNLSKKVEELLNQYIKGKSIENSELRILDWGCGRGRSVLKLKSMGYDAYGVEIDPKPIRNGGPLFQHYGFKADKYLSKIDEKCNVSFPDNYFDIVFSEQVVEHVKNIDLFFEEIARITKSGGITFHAFPNKYHFTEQHLYMPLIHWLPKNSMRKLAIYYWLRLGKDPYWKELTQKSNAQKAEKYYLYSINKTYYRSNRFIEKLLRKVGFQVKMKNLKHKFNFKNINSFFPHTTLILATKSN